MDVASLPKAKICLVQIVGLRRAFTHIYLAQNDLNTVLSTTIDRQLDTYTYTWRYSASRPEDLDCHGGLIPITFMDLPTAILQLSYVLIYNRKTYKPPEPMTGPNSTSRGVIVHLSNDTGRPLAVAR